MSRALAWALIPAIVAAVALAWLFWPSSDDGRHRKGRDR